VLLDISADEALLPGRKATANCGAESAQSEIEAGEFMYEQATQSVKVVRIS
jgi:hypothetical protein